MVEAALSQETSRQRFLEGCREIDGFSSSRTIPGTVNRSETLCEKDGRRLGITVEDGVINARLYRGEDIVGFCQGDRVKIPEDFGKAVPPRLEVTSETRGDGSVCRLNLQE